MPNEKGGYSFYVLVINLEQQENLSVINHGKLSQISISFADNRTVYYRSVVGYCTIDQRKLGLHNLPVMRIFIQL